MNNCHFVIQSHNTTATILKAINLSNAWDSAAWPYSKAVLSVQMNINATIELKGINDDNQVINQGNVG